MKNRIKIVLSVISVILSVVLLVISTILAENKIINLAVATAFVVISTVLVFIAVFYAAKVDYESGVYECRKCGNTYMPTFRAYIWGAQTLKTRYLKCPECGKSSWCIRKNRNNTNT